MTTREPLRPRHRENSTQVWQQTRCHHQQTRLHSRSPPPRTCLADSPVRSTPQRLPWNFPRYRYGAHRYEIRDATHPRFPEPIVRRLQTQEAPSQAVAKSHIESIPDQSAAQVHSTENASDFPAATTPSCRTCCQRLAASDCRRPVRHSRGDKPPAALVCWFLGGIIDRASRSRSCARAPRTCSAALPIASGKHRLAPIFPPIWALRARVWEWSRIQQQLSVRVRD